MKNKFKPCPFCGSEDIKVYGLCGVFWALCNKCKVGTPEFASKEEAQTLKESINRSPP